MFLQPLDVLEIVLERPVGDLLHVLEPHQPLGAVVYPSMRGERMRYLDPVQASVLYDTPPNPASNPRAIISAVLLTGDDESRNGVGNLLRRILCLCLSFDASDWVMTADSCRPIP